MRLIDCGVADPKTFPGDAHLEESRQLLEEMDALLKRVRALMEGHPKPPKPRLVGKRGLRF